MASGRNKIWIDLLQIGISSDNMGRRRNPVGRLDDFDGSLWRLEYREMASRVSI